MEKTDKTAEDLARFSKMSEIYTSIDSCPQTFFFTLIHQMKIKNYKNILEIACGQGLLLPFVIDIKNKDTQYVATDINPFMLQVAEKRLRSNFEKYQSKLPYQEWIKKQKLVFKEANAEQLIQGFEKFDAVICNLVLMLVNKPKNVLQNIYKTTTDEAIMGITIAGDKVASNFYNLMQRSLVALGLPLSSQRSPHYYKQKIYQDLKQTGWQIVFQWQQTAIFPFTQPNDIDPYLNTLNAGLQQYCEEDRTRINTKIVQLYQQFLNSHVPLQMSARLFIVKKVK